MAYRSFEDLEVWQRGCRLAVDVFRAFETCRFPTLRTQIERAALSVPPNIAEGAERGGTREFQQFLKIAKGSCGEARTQLYIAQKLEAVSRPRAQAMVQESKEISAMIQGLRRSLLRTSNPQPTQEPQEPGRSPKPANRPKSRAT